MKMRRTLQVFVLAAVICQTNAVALWVDQVDVIPEMPSDTDIITFDIFGTASGDPSHVAYDEFSQDGTSLQLDLYVDVGLLTGFSNWTYQKQIQPLSPATYSLEVRTFDNYHGTPGSTLTVDFTVVPEPATLAFLGVGLCILRAFSS